VSTQDVSTLHGAARSRRVAAQGVLPEQQDDGERDGGERCGDDEHGRDGDRGAEAEHGEQLAELLDKLRAGLDG
jgi:hypothetical protein